jgi:hypothetical protein
MVVQPIDVQFAIILLLINRNETKMILIISDKNDVHTIKVEDCLTAASIKYMRFNLDVVSLKQTIVSFTGFEWDIECPNGKFKTSEVTVIWNRRTYVELLLDEIDETSVEFKIWKGEWNKTLLGIYSSLESKTWLNFYRDAYYAENKFRQFSVALAVNLKTPTFICSNDINILKSFFDDSKEKVIKYLNQDFYKVTDGSYKGIYVNKILKKDLGTFQKIGENPIILQNYIQKKFEVRYTIVGQEHFVCRIDSQESKIANIDWRRYDLANTPHSIIKPPKDVEKSVRKFMIAFNLNYGALDFIVTESGIWYFLELNSMGQFLWIEDLTGLKISNSIANWLINNN